MLEKAKDTILRPIAKLAACIAMVFLCVLYRLFHAVWCVATVIIVVATMLYCMALGALCRNSGEEYDLITDAKERIEELRSVLDCALEKFK